MPFARIPFAFCVVVALSALRQPAPALATIAPSTLVEAVKAASPPPQDAAFSDPVWKTAVRATAFENGTTHQPATVATTALLLYDDKNLYVAFVADQPGIPLTETQTSNDTGYGLDDEVTVAIDTSGNNSRVYAFTATPLGVKYEFSTESTRYQPPWTTVAKTIGGGYHVMMTIPLSDMRVGGGKTQRWRINFTRYVAARSDILTWAYDPSSTSYCGNNGYETTTYCDSTRWPILNDIHLAGVAKAPPPYADVYGLLSAGADKNVFETTPQTFTDQAARNFGVDATVPFTRSLAFVTAIGPDFSNVETDQITISPQEFPIQYSEYRPFFAQGSNYIDSLPGFSVNGPANQMFYSPSLGIVDEGYKIEGTAGQSSVGLLDVNGDGFDDQAFGYSFNKPDGTLQLALQGVDANHPGIVDRTIGVGGSYQNLHSGFQPIVSYEQETGTLVGSPDLAHQLLLAEITNHGLFQTGFLYKDIGPEFSPIDGYTEINDERGPTAFAVYNGLAAAQSFVKSYRFGLVGDRLVDRSGAAHQADTNENAQIEFRNLLQIGFNVATSELRSYEIAYPSYVDPRNDAFDNNTLSINYRNGTPSPTSASYSFGPYAVSCEGLPVIPLPCKTAVDGVTPAYTQQYDLASTRAFADGYSATLEYGGTLEHAFAGLSDGQFLRRLSLSHSIGSNSQVALTLGLINGTGGYAAPGESLALSYHKKFTNQNQLYFEYGSPAAYRTLQRFVLKYVYHLGPGGAGT